MFSSFCNFLISVQIYVNSYTVLLLDFNTDFAKKQKYNFNNFTLLFVWEFLIIIFFAYFLVFLFICFRFKYVLPINFL